MRAREGGEYEDQQAETLSEVEEARQMSRVGRVEWCRPCDERGRYLSSIRHASVISFFFVREKKGEEKRKYCRRGKKII